MTPVPLTYAITRIGFRGPADIRAAPEADTAGDLWELGRDAKPDWADARRLLRVLQQWHGSRAAEAMPGA